MTVCQLDPPQLPGGALLGGGAGRGGDRVGGEASGTAVGRPRDVPLLRRRQRRRRRPLLLLLLRPLHDHLQHRATLRGPHTRSVRKWSGKNST